MASKNPQPTKKRPAKNYRHPESESPMRPEVGTQAHFKKKLPPKKYRYDSSLSPSLDWDGRNSAREQGEVLIQQTLDAKTLEEAKTAASKLKAMSKPFLNWAGKAERLSFDVPTLPLFIHERLSTKAILETLKGHRLDRNQSSMFDLWGDPQRSVTDQVLRAYEHKDKWVNRMILGDSLVVMNSLLHYEGLGGQVQMVYIDPPYGVKFGSNFQPFVRKRDVSHGDDGDMTREPEMVQAYRDTWELGLHSYLSYLRDRLLVARELLSASGSIFVQISDDNQHSVRDVMDEVFGSENFLGLIAFKKTGYQASGVLPSNYDYICWYAKDVSRAKYRQLYISKWETSAFVGQDLWIEMLDGLRRRMTRNEIDGTDEPPTGARIFRHKLAEGAGDGGNTEPFEFEGRIFKPKAGKHFSTTPSGMRKLAQERRLIVIGNSLRFVNYLDDFPVTPITTVWPDTVVSGFADPQLYVVQTSTKVVQRCILMATDPGELVLDPTCGSGTTAYSAEQWGRRWITIDTSRVPLALARQRLLTATFSWYELQAESRGPASGFVYKRRQNKNGEEVGGIVPHIRQLPVYPRPSQPRFPVADNSTS
jgi:adenine-specific DNA-methyltransferase